MVDFNKKYEEAHNKAERINCLGIVYEKVKTEMQWGSMEYHSADDEHEESWYTEPDEGSYSYNLYCAYQEVLAAIEKLADK